MNLEEKASEWVDVTDGGRRQDDLRRTTALGGGRENADDNSPSHTARRAQPDAARDRTSQFLRQLARPQRQALSRRLPGDAGASAPAISPDPRWTMIRPWSVTRHGPRPDHRPARVGRRSRCAVPAYPCRRRERACRRAAQAREGTGRRRRAASGCAPSAVCEGESSSRFSSAVRIRTQRRSVRRGAVGESTHSRVFSFIFVSHDVSWPQPPRLWRRPVSRWGPARGRNRRSGNGSALSGVRRDGNVRQRRQPRIETDRVAVEVRSRKVTKGARQVESPRPRAR